MLPGNDPVRKRIKNRAETRAELKKMAFLKY